MIDILARAAFDFLKKNAVPIAVAAGSAAAAWYADKKVKEKTGKHIHEHAAEYVKKLWSRLKDWAQGYLQTHEKVRKIYLSAVSVAASIKRAQNAGVRVVKVKVFGIEDNAPKALVIKEEDVPLDEAGEVLEKARTDNILAIRN